MSKKVLVVDDDQDVRSFVVTVLEENQYIPLVAQDGIEGFEMIEKEKPDLVILDVLMPRGSGIRLYRKLKTDENLNQIPIVMFTGIALRSFLKSQKAPKKLLKQRLKQFLVLVLNYLILINLFALKTIFTIT